MIVPWSRFGEVERATRQAERGRESRAKTTSRPSKWQNGSGVETRAVLCGVVVPNRVTARFSTPGRLASSAAKTVAGQLNDIAGQVQYA